MGQVADKLVELKREFKDPNEDHVKFRGSFWLRREAVDPYEMPTFDPMLGFPNGRKVRDPKVTLDEMDEARVPMLNRNYCAYKYIDVMKCFKDTPGWKRVFLGECKHVYHDYCVCEHEQSILQAKEYERECRLLARHKRRIALGLEEAPDSTLQME